MFEILDSFSSFISLALLIALVALAIKYGHLWRSKKDDNEQ
jgi:hypothetical protein